MAAHDDILGKIDATLAGYVVDDPAVSDDAMRHVPTRREGAAEGSLVTVPAAVSREAGFACPVRMSSAVWEDCVAWTGDDHERTGMPQDEDGRLWDVLWMASRAAQGARRTPAAAVAFETQFEVWRVSRFALPGEDGVEPTPVYLTLRLGEDEGGPVAVIVLAVAV